MKTKLLKKLVAILCILVIIIPTPLSVIAKIDKTEAGTTLDFGITLLHKSKTLDGKKEVEFGYSTETSSKPVYRIYSGTNDYDTTVLCLDKDKRYPKEDKEETKAEYTSKGEATEQILQEVQKNLDTEKAKKVLWLIKNAIIPEDSEAVKDLKLAKIFESDLTGNETSKLTLDQLKKELTEDDLVFAMQFALYEMTNNLKLGAPQGTKDGTTWASLNGTTFGYKGKYITRLIEFYVQQMQTSDSPDLIDNQSGDEDSIQIVNAKEGNTEDDKAGITQKGGYAFIGPFKITGAEGSNYAVKILLLKEDGTDADSNFFILDNPDDNANKLSCTPQDLNNKNFYIQVRTNTPAKKVKIEVTSGISIETAKGYVWTNNDDAQPLLSLERKENKPKENEKTFEFEVKNEKEYDVALRKYITSVKRKDANSNLWRQVYRSDQGETRTPTGPVAEEKQTDGAFNQYEYKHRKDPLEVQVGDKVTFTIKIINEESSNVKVTEVTDYLPPKGLKYLPDEDDNKNNKWQYNEEENKVTTNYFSTFSPTKELDTKTTRIVLEVTDELIGKDITNIAEITKFEDTHSGAEITEDLDSGPGNVKLPATDEEWITYKGNEDNPDDLSDPDYYYKGQQDDDDFEKVIVKIDESEYDVQIEKEDADYPDKKLQGAEFSVILPDKTTQTITTQTGGIASTEKIKITNIDDEVISFTETKAPAGYRLIEGTFILDVKKEVQDGKYAIKDVSLREENTDIATVSVDTTKKKIILKIKNKQDAFDLRLRKFITQVGETEINDRKPEVTYKDGLLNYKHSKDAVTVKKGQRVVYTIRVYNEGVEDGYAAEIKDDIPNGLTFLPDDQTNQDFGWKMYDSNGQQTTEVANAKTIKTEYLSKAESDKRDDKPLKAFNPQGTIGDNNPDFRDVQVAFQVTKSDATEEDKTIINTAEISKDQDKDGNDVTDVDSTPDNNIETEDDLDKEYIQLEIEQSNYKIQIEKVDKNNPEQKLANAEFSVTLPDNKTETIVTDENGIATTSAINVTNANDETIVIKETKAPNGYKIVEEIFTIKVTKGIENGQYVLKTLQLAEESENADLSVDIEGNSIKLTIKDKTDAFDLRLRKFITEVDGSARTDRTPEVTFEESRLKYNHSKVPVTVEKGQKVVYTIRVYNEGIEDGYAAEIKDDIPQGLTFLPNDVTNVKYGWKMYDSNGEETTNVSDAVTIRTNYLSKEQSEARNEDNLLKAFDSSKSISNQNPDNREVKVAFRVNTDDTVTSKQTIVNTAEISKNQNKDGQEVEDVDSIPDNNAEKEDDIDSEYIQVIIKEFDLGLRKFITQIGEKQISGRTPEPKLENGKLTYKHTKTPLTVVQGQRIVYTIRVYNEGKQDGYAAEITDDLPEGLTFLPNDEINKEYGWKMYDSHANEVQNALDALEIRTNYLSKEESEKRGEDNLLKAFDSSAQISNTNPDYRDVKIAFQVNTDSMSSKNKTIINTAEISQDEDENGNEVEDIDSKPDNGEPDEDDIDKEYVEPKYFDLSLLKYVSKVIVTEDGVTKETETGYDGTENPEPIVKVELDRKKLDKTEVKYIYTIKITNEGEIEGYAKEITDRIPEGLEFYEEDNKQYGWKVKEKGIVTTDYLKDKLLQPGESATVQIVLRWVKSDKNLGQKTNVAEITVDDNPYDAPDIDSTPNNNKDGEDDQDNASVLLSISTGTNGPYVILVIGLITLMGLGVYVITKHVIIE